MLFSLFVTFLVIGVFCVLFYVPATFAVSIAKMQASGLSVKEQVIYRLPVINIILAERTYTGRLSINLLVDIIFLVIVALRLIVRAVMPGTVFSAITGVLVVLAVLALWAANSYLVFIILHDADVKSVISCIFNAVFFTIGQHYIATYMAAEVAAMERSRETFG